MIRRALIGALAAGLITVFTAGPAAAAPETTTSHEHGLVETFVDVVPTCDNSAPAPYTITTTSNLVEHETVFADGRVHATFTQTGKFVTIRMRTPGNFVDSSPISPAPFCLRKETPSSTTSGFSQPTPFS